MSPFIGLSTAEGGFLARRGPLLILGAMLLWRLAPVGGWISRWPMAFIIGVFCGLRLVSFLSSLGILAVLFVTIELGDWVGATAAATAFMAGRLAANGYLIPKTGT